MKSMGLMILLFSAALFSGGIFLIQKGMGDSDEHSPYIEINSTSSCDVSIEKCEIKYRDFFVSMDTVEKPAALKSFPVIVSVISDKKINDIDMIFSMKGMEMGSNRYRMKQEDDGRWKADVILPICTTGRRDWIIELIIDGEVRYKARFDITL